MSIPTNQGRLLVSHWLTPMAIHDYQYP